MAVTTTTAMRGPMVLKDWAQLLLLGAIWGGSFFFARIAVAEVPPLVLVLFRVAIAALALTSATLAGRPCSRRSFPWRRRPRRSWPASRPSPWGSREPASP